MKPVKDAHMLAEHFSAYTQWRGDVASGIGELAASDRSSGTPTTAAASARNISASGSDAEWCLGGPITKVTHMLLRSSAFLAS